MKKGNASPSKKAKHNSTPEERIKELEIRLSTLEQKHTAVVKNLKGLIRHYNYTCGILERMGAQVDEAYELANIALE